MAIDNFQAALDYEAASVLIKNTLDEKFGSSWQCAVRLVSRRSWRHLLQKLEVGQVIAKV